MFWWYLFLHQKLLLPPTNMGNILQRRLLLCFYHHPYRKKGQSFSQSSPDHTTVYQVYFQTVCRSTLNFFFSAYCLSFHFLVLDAAFLHFLF